MAGIAVSASVRITIHGDADQVAPPKARLRHPFEAPGRAGRWPPPTGCLPLLFPSDRPELSDVLSGQLPQLGFDRSGKAGRIVVSRTVNDGLESGAKAPQFDSEGGGRATILELPDQRNGGRELGRRVGSVVGYEGCPGCAIGRESQTKRFVRAPSVFRGPSQFSVVRVGPGPSPRVRIHPPFFG